MRNPFWVTLILVVSLSGCNMPGAAVTPVAPAVEGPAAGMPAYFTNASAPAEPAVPSGPQVGSKMVWVDNSILVFVPGGEFIRGTEGGEDNPIYKVTVSPFWIYRAEVTNTQYAMCIAAGECSALEDPEAAAKLSEPALRDHPVVGVTYSQGEAYCTWIKGDLPTEAQWEKTARGPQANIYPWGDEAPTCDLTNFNNCNLETTNIRQHLTGKSYYEALDLAGNVFEWALDWYGGDYYKTAPPADPPGPPNGVQRVVRGGGYQTVDADLLSARRFSLDPLKTRPDLGFRCVVNDPGSFAPYCQASPLLTGNSFPGGSNPDESQSSCEPPNVYVGGSYCTNNKAYVNVFTEGEATIIGDELSCSPAADGLVTCSGPNFYSGEVQVCGTCDVPPVPQEPAQGQAEIPPGPGDQCPNPGYSFDEASQACIWNGDPNVPHAFGGGVFCPVGSEPDPRGSICTAPPQPADGQGECPSWGYYYDPNSQMCLWRVAGSGPHLLRYYPDERAGTSALIHTSARSRWSWMQAARSVCRSGLETMMWLRNVRTEYATRLPTTLPARWERTSTRAWMCACLPAIPPRLRAASPGLSLTPNSPAARSPQIQTLRLARRDS